LRCTLSGGVPPAPPSAAMDGELLRWSRRASRFASPQQKNVVSRRRATLTAGEARRGH